MTEEKKSCALCSLPVKLDAFNLLTKKNELLYFCCEGCKNIYAMLYAEKFEHEPNSDDV